MEGEFVSLEEMLIVSPGWGRFQRHAVDEGARIEPGTVLGMVRNGGPDLAITSPVRGVFLAWIAWGGEHLSPGTPIARVTVDGL